MNLLPCCTSQDGGVMPVHTLKRLHGELWAAYSLPFSFRPVVCICPQFLLIYETPCYEISIYLEMKVSWQTLFLFLWFYHLELTSWLWAQYWKQELKFCTLLSSPPPPPHPHPRTGCLCQLWWREIKEVYVAVAFSLSSELRGTKFVCWFSEEKWMTLLWAG